MSHVILNGFLALMVAGLMIATFNHMNKRRTPAAVILAALVIFAGLVGQALGVLGGKILHIEAWGWQHFVDTLLYGGIGAFLLACRRYPLMGSRPKTVDRLSIAVSGLTIFVSLMVV